MFKISYANERAQKRSIEFSTRRGYEHCTRSFCTWLLEEDEYLLNNFNLDNIEYLSHLFQRSDQSLIVRYEQLIKKQPSRELKMNTPIPPKKGYIVVKKSIVSNSYAFTDNPFIHETQADAIKEAQRLLQKTLAIGTTGIEFQVLKIDKIVRPVVVSPIEVV